MKVGNDVNNIDFIVLFAFALKEFLVYGLSLENTYLYMLLWMFMFLEFYEIILHIKTISLSNEKFNYATYRYFYLEIEIVNVCYLEIVTLKLTFQ